MDGDGNSTFWRGLWAIPHVRWWIYALGVDLVGQALFSFDSHAVQIVAAILSVISIAMYIWGPIASWLECRRDD